MERPQQETAAPGPAAAGSADAGGVLRPRRREKNPDQWKRVQRKNRRIAGQQYINTKGQLVQPKQMGAACGCRMKCYTRVDDSTRECIFNGFYALKSYDEQNAYLFGLIRKKEIARVTGASDRRTCNYQYFVRCKGREIQVCKQAFANIHAITFKKIRMLSQKLDQNVMFPRDQRGKHMNRPGKISDELKDQVRKHIEGVLKSVELRTFLKEDKVYGLDINISKMHKNYLKQFEPMAFEDINASDKLRDGYQPQVKIWLYSNMYHTEFRFTNLNTLRNAQQGAPLRQDAAAPGEPAAAGAVAGVRPAPRRAAGRAAGRAPRRERTATPAAMAAPPPDPSPSPSPSTTTGGPAAPVPAAPLVVHQLQHLPDAHTDLMNLAVEQMESGYQQLVFQPAGRGGGGGAGGCESLQLCLPLNCLSQPLNLQAQPLNLHTAHTVFSVQAAPAAAQFDEPPQDGATGQLTDYGGEVHLVAAAGAGGGLYDWQLAAE